MAFSVCAIICYLLLLTNVADERTKRNAQQQSREALSTFPKTERQLANLGKTFQGPHFSGFCCTAILIPLGGKNRDRKTLQSISVPPEFYLWRKCFRGVDSRCLVKVRRGVHFEAFSIEKRHGRFRFAVASPKRKTKWTVDFLIKYGREETDS